MARQKIRFGIIGLGLMGREFGSAAARWMHLTDLNVQPVITAVCDVNQALMPWFTDNFESIKLATTDYHDLLNSDDVDAIYCAVPHNLHEKFYTDILKSGKHLLGEKPFGIDKAANTAILQAIDESDSFVACSSEFPFFPGARRIWQAIEANRFGKIIEVETGLLHSSDLNPDKKINWKRMIAINGEYGCMGDLGMHAFHMPLRAGWMPKNIHALLTNIMTERYNADGEQVPCETWDNAIMAGQVSSPDYGDFPITFKTYRIAPGETNTWYLRILGTEHSISYSTRHPKSLYTMDYKAGGSQLWAEDNLGFDTAYQTITGGIFEFGMSDALMQMWAAFCDELVNGRDDMQQPFYCATPHEAAQTHDIMTASLQSQKNQSTVALT